MGCSRSAWVALSLWAGSFRSRRGSWHEKWRLFLFFSFSSSFQFLSIQLFSFLNSVGLCPKEELVNVAIFAGVLVLQALESPRVAHLTCKLAQLMLHDGPSSFLNRLVCTRSCFVFFFPRIIQSIMSPVHFFIYLRPLSTFWFLNFSRRSIRLHISCTEFRIIYIVKRRTKHGTGTTVVLCHFCWFKSPSQS